MRTGWAENSGDLPLTFLMRHATSALAALILGASVIAPAYAKELTDAEVKARLVLESQSVYSGNCPCPYSTMRNGRSCGGRSAYSRPGGATLLCYPADVTDQMVKDWRKKKE